jgi:hypothetical protein
MPKLPDFTALGERPSLRPQRGIVSDQSGQIIGQAVEGLGNTAIQVQEQRYLRDVNLARAQASNALLDHEIAVRAKSDEIQKRVQSGELPYEEARQTFDHDISTIQAPEIKHLDQIGAQNLKKGIERNSFNGRLDIDKSVDIARRTDFKAQFSGGLDKLGKLAGMPGANIDEINSKAQAYEPLARASGIPKDIVDKAIQDFKDKNWLNHATQRSMETKDSLSGIKQLERDLTAKDGYYAGKLDTDKRNAVLNAVTNNRLRIEYRQQHESDKREANALRALNTIDQQIATGVPATAQMWASWESQVKGTSSESEFKTRLGDEQEVQKVLRQPIGDQVKFVQDQAAALDTGGGTLRQRANLARLNNAVQANVKQLSDAPLLFNANRAGQEVAPLNLAMLGTDDAGITAQMKDRMATITSMRKTYGQQVQVKPLLPQEASQLSSALATATPEKQTELFASLYNAVHDVQAYKGIMAQIAPDSPVRALAGMLAAKQKTLTLENHWFKPDELAVSGDVAKTMLQGESLLNATKTQKGEDGKSKTGLYLPEDKTLQAEFQNYVGAAFAGRTGAAETAFQAVKAYYVGKAAQTGRLAASNQDIDTSLVKESVKAALGTVVDYNGNGEVLAPWGMDENTFEDRAQAALKTANIDADVGLLNQGEGTYYVRQGRNFLTDKAGKPVVVNVLQ